MPMVLGVGPLLGPRTGNNPGAFHGGAAGCSSSSASTGGPDFVFGKTSSCLFRGPPETWAPTTMQLLHTKHQQHEQPLATGGAPAAGSYAQRPHLRSSHESSTPDSEQHLLQPVAVTGGTATSRSAQEVRYVLAAAQRQRETQEEQALAAGAGRRGGGGSSPVSSPRHFIVHTGGPEDDEVDITTRIVGSEADAEEQEDEPLGILNLRNLQQRGEHERDDEDASSGTASTNLDAIEEGQETLSEAMTKLSLSKRGGAFSSDNMSWVSAEGAAGGGRSSKTPATTGGGHGVDTHRAADASSVTVDLDHLQEVQEASSLWVDHLQELQELREDEIIMVTSSMSEEEVAAAGSMIASHHHQLLGKTKNLRGRGCLEARGGSSVVQVGGGRSSALTSIGDVEQDVSFRSADRWTTTEASLAAAHNGTTLTEQNVKMWQDEMLRPVPRAPGPCLFSDKDDQPASSAAAGKRDANSSKEDQLHWQLWRYKQAPGGNGGQGGHDRQVQQDEGAPPAGVGRGAAAGLSSFEMNHPPPTAGLPPATRGAAGHGHIRVDSDHTFGRDLFD
ncbi:unnamed protein product [Amoebophrya sp. A120]|nr:unnamed protein product [Amoebophrya sp. A120]|eukprot:GSA120T00017458001.1